MPVPASPSGCEKSINLYIEVSSENCDTITMEDITGDYNASTNTGGWGAPNWDRADVTSATIDVLDGDNNSILTSPIDITAEVIAGTTSFEISAPDQIGATNFEDGMYCVVLGIDFTGCDGTWYTQSCMLLPCGVCCKLQKIAACVSTCVSCDNDKDLDNFLKVYGIYKSLSLSASCMNNQAVNDTLEALNKKLDFLNCKNCGC